MKPEKFLIFQATFSAKGVSYKKKSAEDLGRWRTQGILRDS